MRTGDGMSPLACQDRHVRTDLPHIWAAPGAVTKSSSDAACTPLVCTVSFRCLENSYMSCHAETRVPLVDGCGPDQGSRRNCYSLQIRKATTFYIRETLQNVALSFGWCAN